MCGIAGMADFSGRPAERALLGRMCAALRHRGPDDEGIQTFPLQARSGATAALGSRRLSIIDVAGGHQPVSNEDESIWAVQNGEIYNFAALRAELETAGHRFRSRSDTEVIVHLYEERGPEFVAALDGMFAIALWDEPAQRLLLARDRFGKKPLFYGESRERLSFASELQALVLDSQLDRSLDEQALAHYLTWMSIPAPLSIYRGIRKLPPAHFLVRDPAGSRLERYWRLPYLPKHEISEDAAAERVLQLLREAVRKRLVSDVPLGALLSGGIDSSAVVGLMAGLIDRPVKTFSIGFAEAGYDETPHARRVAERWGCDHHEFVVTPRAIEILPQLVRHYGEPFADSSAIPSYYLAKLTRDHVTVALNGDGGDEAFGGYERHLGARLAEAWQRVPRALAAPVEGLAGWLAPDGSRRGTLARGRRFFEAARLDRARRYERWVGVVTGDLRERLRPGAGAVVARDLASLFGEARDLDAVDAALYLDTLFYLPTDLLVKMDVASMCHSLEARSPFLDQHLVEFVARLPSTMKIRGGRKKHLLRRALRELVPPQNLDRPKAGFAVPIGAWLRGELRSFATDHLLDARARQRGLLDPDVVERLARAHFAGEADYAHHLWTLLMLELWHRTWVDA